MAFQQTAPANWAFILAKTFAWGLIAIGMNVLFSPQGGSGSMFVIATAVGQFFALIYALILGLPGIVLLLIIDRTHTRYSGSETIQTWNNYILAFIFMAGMLGIRVATGFDLAAFIAGIGIRPLVIGIGLIAGLGLLLTKLSLGFEQRANN